jgi:DNA topoisomerase IB
VDGQGRRHAIDSGQVNDYLRQHLGGDFTAKDFRTWHATLRACELLMQRRRPEPCTDRGCKRVFTEVINEVAARLRNTPAVCRKSYVNPLVLQAWQQGHAPFGRAGPRRGAGPLLSLLRRSAGAGPIEAGPREAVRRR